MNALKKIVKPLKRVGKESVTFGVEFCLLELVGWAEHDTLVGFSVQRGS